MKRTIAGLSALVGLQALLLTLVATPASANTSQGYVGGADTVTDDWGDEGALSQTSHSYSGATGLWQWVLYADGAKESNGTAFDQADIDCHFGPNTAAATRSWQSTHQLGVDGIVGTQTFGAADGHLRVSVLLDSSTIELHYVGSVHTVDLARFDGAYFLVVPGVGAEIKATYSAPGTPNGIDCWQ